MDIKMSEEKETYVERKYREFYEKSGYIPKYFVPYNCLEVTDYAPTLTANSNTSFGKSGTVLIVVNEDK